MAEFGQGLHVDQSTGTGAESRLLRPAADLIRRTPALIHLSEVIDGDRISSVDGGDPDLRTRRQIVASGVTSWFLGLHDKLQTARTGSLIRLVLETPRGALLACTIPNGHLVGFALRERPPGHGTALPPAAEIRAADEAVARLATLAREFYALSSQNPGSFQPVALPEPVGPAKRAPTVTGIGEVRALDLCRAAVNERLQYVLYLNGGDGAFAVDHFDGLDLPQTHGSTSPARLRRVYRSLGAELEEDLRDLRRLVYPVLGRHAAVTTLDVEDGAVLVRWLSGGRRAVGVTLVQQYVGAAEAEFAELARRLESAG